MARFRCEMFGHFAYDAALSYEDMLETETRLVAELEALLLDAGAAHLDFVQDGDALEVRCAFMATEVERFAALCWAMSTMLGDSVTARVLFVGTGLAEIYIYGMTQDSCQCSVMEIMPPDAQKPLDIQIAALQG